MSISRETRIRRRRMTTVAAAWAVPAALVLAGCAASGADVAESAVPTYSPTSAPSSATPTDSPAPTPIAMPETVPGEIARAEFLSEGPDGIPSNASISSDLIGADYMVEGECSGTRAKFRLTTASVDVESVTLLEGTIDCDQPYASSMSGSTYRGPVQLSFTDANGIDSGWLRVVPTATTP